MAPVLPRAPIDPLGLTVVGFNRLSLVPPAAKDEEEPSCGEVVRLEPLPPAEPAVVGLPTL